LYFIIINENNKLSALRGGVYHMKWVAISVTAVMLAAASPYGWAQSPMKSPQTEGAQATGAAVKAQETVSPAERKAYEKKMTEELKVIDTKIGDLRVKTAQLPSQKKRMALFHMQYLYNQAVTAKTQLGNLIKSQGKAWDQARVTLEATMQELTSNVAAAELKY
jgi:hypothetical protein